MQPVDVLSGIERGQQRLRAGIVVGIVERLHRDLQQHLMTAGARTRDLTLEIAAIGRERERHCARQLADGVIGGAGADAEPADHDRDARRVRLAGDGPDGAGEDVGRPRAVLRHLRQQAMARGLAHALVERGELGFGSGGLGVARAGHHDVLALAAGAVDDGDGLAAGWRRAAACCASLAAAAALAPGIGRGGGLLGRLAGIRASVGGHDRHRLAAEGIVGEHRPAREHGDGEPQQTGNDRRAPRAAAPRSAASRPGSVRAGRSGHPPRCWPSRIIRQRLASTVVNSSFTREPVVPKKQWGGPRPPRCDSMKPVALSSARWWTWDSAGRPSSS